MHGQDRSQRTQSRDVWREMRQFEGEEDGSTTAPGVVVGRPTDGPLLLLVVRARGVVVRGPIVATPIVRVGRLGRRRRRTGLDAAGIMLTRGLDPVVERAQVAGLRRRLGRVAVRAGRRRRTVVAAAGRVRRRTVPVVGPVAIRIGRLRGRRRRSTEAAIVVAGRARVLVDGSAIVLVVRRAARISAKSSAVERTDRSQQAPAEEAAGSSREDACPRAEVVRSARAGMTDWARTDRGRRGGRTTPEGSCRDAREEAEAMAAAGDDVQAAAAESGRSDCVDCVHQRGSARVTTHR